MSVPSAENDFGAKVKWNFTQLEGTVRIPRLPFLVRSAANYFAFKPTSEIICPELIGRVKNESTGAKTVI